MKRSFFIAGVKFRPRAEIDKAMKEIKVGDILHIVPEPENKFDPNAVRIYRDVGVMEPVFLGYVPKRFSSEVSALLEPIDLKCIVEEVNPDAKTWEMCKVIITDDYLTEESEEV